MFLPLLQRSFLEMILLLFLPVSLCLRLDLLNLMDVNITTCLQSWLKLFKIWPLHLLHQEVKVKIVVMLIVLLDLLNLMVINITTCLQFWLKPYKIWPLQVEVKIMVMVMVMLIFLLDLLNLMVINITTKPAADHME